MKPVAPGGTETVVPTTGTKVVPPSKETRIGVVVSVPSVALNPKPGSA